MNHHLPEKYQILPYRPCVGLVLLNADGQIFVGDRIDLPGAWQMPQGGVDEGETPEQTAIRELKEEVGTDQAEIIRKAPETFKYDLPAERIPSFWNGRFRGQEQTWFALRFTGKDSDIILDAHEEPEFSAWKWASKDHIMDTIVPFKRELYARVFEEFSDLIA